MCGAQLCRLHYWPILLSKRRRLYRGSQQRKILTHAQYIHMTWYSSAQSSRAMVSAGWNNLPYSRWNHRCAEVGRALRDDLLWTEKVSSSINKKNERNYEVALPFKRSDIAMPNNYGQVCYRIYRLNIQLMKNI